MLYLLRQIIIGVFIIFLSGCETESTVYAPVTELSTIDPIPANPVYRVQRGETLYSIAWRYGLDYRYLAAINHIPMPYHIHVHAGQLLYLRAGISPTKWTAPSPQKKNSVVTQFREPILPEKNIQVTQWHWPAKGPIVGNFSASNKGVNIGGRLGDPVFATAAGRVVYSGNGLRGYGNLIIIKHNSAFLTAYAHNNYVLVKEGDRVSAGQKIAEMGNSGARRVMLHFEIRRSGQPLDPLNYLR